MDNGFQVEGLVAADGLTAADHNSLSFTILGNPRAQERHRIKRLHTIKVPLFYDPSSNLKKAYAIKVREALVEMGLTHLPYFTPQNAPPGPSREEMVGLMAQIHFLVPRPVSHFWPNSRILKPSAPLYPRQKDIDNMLKFTLDALQGVVYKNDTSIRSVAMGKDYTLAEVGSTTIFIKEF
jgi:hypothetical protein